MRKEFKKIRKGAQKTQQRARAYVKEKTAQVKLIKSVIAAENETKFCAVTVRYGAHNSEITQTDMIPCLPKLVQDQGEGNAYERLSTKISPRKLSLHCQVGWGPNLTRSGAITVYWFVLTSKSYKSMTGVLANANMQRLLRTGDSNQYGPFSGSPDTAMLPVNNTDFNVIKRGSFNLSKNTGVVQDITTAGNQPVAGPLMKKWVVNIPCPSKLIYEQDNNSPRVEYYPNNFAPFVVFGYTHQDQTIPDYTNQDIWVTAKSQIWYDDA